ncbi:Demethylmenaquinone methyltransferase [Arthrobacter sp. cf158]|uniref:RraA family protein n=1 Tax=Arthrobacter sp. cf158 TaxID=1761744 RepID=UPI0008958589|nr:RraA family protein [Arthrobacter sp. cf158]SDX50185.1 Demethylmenaquinone methyltransferase [Arthrobacter sp. cf158]
MGEHNHDHHHHDHQHDTLSVEPIAADVEEISKRFRAVLAGHVSDALEHVGIRTPHLSQAIQPITTNVAFAGPAATLRLAKCRTGNESRGLVKLKELHAKPGDVLLVDADGLTDAAVWGDRAALGAKKQNLAAAVVNGAVRDVAEFEKHDWPVHAAGRSLRASEGVYQSVGFNVPIVIDGVLINPGDWLVGDESGIAVVPSEILMKVLELAEEREEIDRSSQVDIENGMSPSAAHRHFHDDDVAHLHSLE